MVLEAVHHVRDTRSKRRHHRSKAYAGAHRRAATVPVLLIPGFMAGDWSLARMAAGLRLEGFRTYRSHISINVGCTAESVDRLEQRVESIVLRRGTKAMIVGHSLGGMLARGLAARRPDLVAGIVTMGSPVMAPGAIHQLLAWDAEFLGRLNRAGLAKTMGSDCMSGPCAKNSFEEMRQPLAPEVGFTAIFSPRDGIVSPSSCLDPYAQQHIEVRASHVGMALDPITFDHVVASLRSFEAAQAAAAMPASDVAGPSAKAGPRPAVST